MKINDNPREIENFFKKVSNMSDQEFEVFFQNLGEELKNVPPDHVDLMLEIGMKQAENRAKKFLKSIDTNIKK
jgi:hypothetical protein